MNNKVNIVVNDLINYQNTRKLSWMQVYKEIIKKYNINYNDITFLNDVIKEITIKGYDIKDNPFKLEEY